MNAYSGISLLINDAIDTREHTDCCSYKSNTKQVHRHNLYSIAVVSNARETECLQHI